MTRGHKVQTRLFSGLLGRHGYRELLTWGNLWANISWQLCDNLLDKTIDHARL